MKYRWDKKYLYWGLTGFLTIVCSVLICGLFFYMGQVMDWFRVIGNILSPFVYGLAFAYLLTPAVGALERLLMRVLPQKTEKAKRTSGKVARVFAILIAFSLTILIIASVITMILTQLPQSLQNFIAALPSYVDSIEAWIATFLADNPTLVTLANTTLNSWYLSLDQWIDAVLPSVDGLIFSLTSSVWGILNTCLDVFVGIIVAINVIYSREMFAAQSKKVLYAIFPTKPTNTMISTLRTTNRTFMNFFVGKLLDSLIMGLICFILTSLLNLPFALIISVIIGITNIIPFFGPFIGAIPCIFLLLLEDPMSALYFAVLILALQQFDGNILGPKILGDSTGLSSFWVIFAILLGGGLFGFIGMLTGVPLFAVIYSFVKMFVELRLDKRGLPTQSANYKDVDHVSVEKQLVQKEKKHTAEKPAVVDKTT